FLVLGAGAELRLRLAARFEPGDEFVARLDRGHVDLVTSHASFRHFLLARDLFRKPASTFREHAQKAATLNMVRRKGQCEKAQASPPDCVDCIDSTWKFVFYFCS